MNLVKDLLTSRRDRCTHRTNGRIIRIYFNKDNRDEKDVETLAAGSRPSLFLYLPPEVLPSELMDFSFKAVSVSAPYLTNCTTIMF
jgi:hypothetical protein